MQIFSENFRGFRWIEVDLEKITFLIGDNSSGKSSILYLVDAISKCDLMHSPKFDEEFGIGEHDYFSPYFNYDDVIFGYSDDRNNGLKKAITVKRVKDDRPEITRCSYFSDGKFISFRKRGSNILAKFVEIDSNISNSEFISIHKEPSGYKVSKDAVEVPLGNPSIIFSALDTKMLGLRNLVSNTFSNLVHKTRISSPIRALPEAFYTNKRKFDTQGLHFATMWLDFNTEDQNDIFSDIRLFGKTSKLFEDISVRQISSRIDGSPLIVSVKKSGKEFFLNQVGIGVSQVVPILVESVFALTDPEKETRVLIQQPELHLHPVAQAALGTYLYSSASKGLRGIFETHSSYLLDRFRADMRDSYKEESDGNNVNKFGCEDIEVIFCQNKDSGNSFHKITIEKSGSLTGEPEEFHSFFVDEFIRTMF